MSTKTNQSTCHCQSDVLVISKKTASYTVSGLLLITFFVFIAGYFWGHQKAIQEFSDSAEQQSFADQIHYSLSCSIDDKPPLYTYNDTDEQCEDEQTDEAAVQQTVPVATETTRSAASTTQAYCAQLAGFQSKQKAEQCLQQITRKGLSAKIVKRSSTTSKGKLYTWHQVVTTPFKSKDELINRLATIQQIVKLHDVRVVSA